MLSKIQNFPILLLIFIKRNIKQISIFLITILFILALILIYLIKTGPLDYQQNVMINMIYLHLPVAILSVLIYIAVAILACFSLIYKNKITYLIAISCVKINTLFCFLAIFTGALWGRPIWGVFWQWEPRLTSMLILLLFNISQLLILSSVKNPLSVKKEFCILSIMGLINIPIVKFSVYFLSSIHQKSSIISKKGILIDNLILKPLIFAFIFFLVYLLLIFILQFLTYYKKIVLMQKIKN